MKQVTNRVCLVAKARALERSVIGPKVIDVAGFLAAVEKRIGMDFFRCSQMVAVALELPDVAGLVSAGYGSALPDSPDRYHLIDGRRYLKRCQAYPALACKVVLVSWSMARTMNLITVPTDATHVIVGVHVSDGVTDNGEVTQSWQVADEV